MIKLFGDLLNRFEQVRKKGQDDIAIATIYAMFLSFALTLLAFLLA
ncbi:MAG: hypothetical protein AAF959_19145 [Cyanobacteria bacterium P01_D01_bin.56]